MRKNTPLLDTVGPSRDGDAFHYRWAARRCLHLLRQDSSVEFIAIEGASAEEASHQGDLVIDVAEYAFADQGVRKVDYYQLKHSTLRAASPMSFSGLKPTLKGFCAKYATRNASRTNGIRHEPNNFVIVTNRLVNKKVKDVLRCISLNGICGSQKERKVQLGLIKAIGLPPNDAKLFFSSLRIFDGETNYVGQKQQLIYETGRLLSERPPDEIISHLIALVGEQALSNGRRNISREDVLHAMGVQNVEDLFPAPPQWEIIASRLSRPCYGELLKKIKDLSGSIIIQAAGGVGKSTFCQYILDHVPVGSVCIGYDCFGRGNYRRASQPRHRCIDGFTQITNELALRGLCSLKVPNSRLDDTQLTRAFLATITDAIGNIRSINASGSLFILVDAADNAAMAALDKSRDSFAGLLLQEKIPDGCTIVFLCRPERVHLLKANESIPRLELPEFNEAESLEHLHGVFPQVENGAEFHRLTSANPRIQAVYLNSNRHQSYDDLLRSLGNSPVSLDEHFSRNLSQAMRGLPGRSGISPEEVEIICTGLALLPPAIPMGLLAQVAGVSIETIRSFISDLSRPLVEFGEYIQFRDEPTESWFRSNYTGTPESIRAFCCRIMKAAETSAYASEILPALLHKSGQYEAIIELALSGKFLPEEGIASKQIVHHRLQFAIRSAIVREQWADAARLALRAGEESAGQDRLFKLLCDNTDLTTALLPLEQVRELAFRRTLTDHWEGSSNLYTASLLLQISPEHVGEAKSYLRSAISWIRTHIEKNRLIKNEWDKFNPSAQTIAEIALSRMHIEGPALAGKWLGGVSQGKTVFEATCILAARMIDRCEYGALETVSASIKQNIWCCLAICKEYESIARYPDKAFLKNVLRNLRNAKSPIFAAAPYEVGVSSLRSAILAALEGCARIGIPSQDIIRVLNRYEPERADVDIWRHEYTDERRSVFFRFVALRAHLLGSKSIDIATLVPKQLSDGTTKSSESKESYNRFVGIGNRLAPWFMTRVDKIVDSRTLVGPRIAKLLDGTPTQWTQDDPAIRRIISSIRLDLILRTNITEGHLDSSALSFMTPDNHPGFQDVCRALRAANHLPVGHFQTIRRDIEEFLRVLLVDMRFEDGPDQAAQSYLDVARAVLPTSRSDARAYFSRAADITEKFGDEAIFRWSSLVALAKKAAPAPELRAQVSFRYWKCAEMIGDHVQREKYWDREEAIRVGTRLHPVSALAAIARWDDRGVGYGGYIRSVALELLAAQLVPGEEIWPLSRFFACYQDVKFTEACLLHASSKDYAQVIFDQAIIDLANDDSPLCDYEHLLKAGDSLRLNTDHCRARVEANRVLPAVSTRDDSYYQPSVGVAPPTYRDLIQSGRHDTVGGVMDIFNSFIKLAPRNPDVFWRELLSSISADLVPDVLNELAQDPTFSLYGYQSILTLLSSDIGKRVGVHDNWPKFYRLVGRAHAQEILAWNSHDIEPFSKVVSDDPLLARALRQGVIEGISMDEDELGSQALYGLVRFLVGDLSPATAADQLNQGIGRFEQYYRQDMGDGVWTTAYAPPEDIHQALAGYLWAALGSPIASMRWQATYALRLYGQRSTSRVVESLVSRFALPDAGAFCNKSHHFYRDYAKLHALIAFARISAERIRLPKKVRDLVLDCAAVCHSHILQRHFAAEAIVHSVGQFTQAQVRSARRACRSPFPPKMLESTLGGDGMHGSHEVDHLMQYDFEKHWIRPLARRFQLTTDEIKTDLKREVQGYFLVNPAVPLADPRQSWFNRLQRAEGYPSWDESPSLSNYRFYLCEQAFDRIFARLLANRPMVWDRWDSPDIRSWESRLGYRTLARNDGYWASDRRQPIPIAQVALYRQVIAWSQEESRPIVAIDDLIHLRIDNSDFLAIAGFMEFRHQGHSIDVHVSCSLVAANRAQSLLRSLSSYRNHDDYRFPDADDDEFSIQQGSFMLRGLVQHHDTSPGIDRRDPYSHGLLDDPSQLDPKIARRFRVAADKERPLLRCEKTGTPVVSFAAWHGRSRVPEGRSEEDSLCSGRITALNKNYIHRLDDTSKAQLLIRIQISHNSRESDEKAQGESSRSEIQYLLLFTPDGVQRVRADPRAR